jgi:hypothetical protein
MIAVQQYAPNLRILTFTLLEMSGIPSVTRICKESGSRVEVKLHTTKPKFLKAC